MTSSIQTIEKAWYERFAQETAIVLPRSTQASILQWMLGENPARIEAMSPEQLAILDQGMSYRYALLSKRYLNSNPTQNYNNLIHRLGSIAVIRNRILTGIALSRDRHQPIADVLQEIIQEMIQSDHYIQSQMEWIAQCTPDKRLRNSLLFASLEEYCLRPIRSQPLLTYRFVNYLRRSKRGGLTQIPPKGKIHLLLGEMNDSDENNVFPNWLDNEAIATYNNQQEWEEQQLLRSQVQQELADYLADKVGDDAVQWLQLYLQGQTQDAIAQTLNLPIQQMYRLREKIAYHALRNFALKSHPDLVAHWLETSVSEHYLGLTPSQWTGFYASLSPLQLRIVNERQLGQSLEAIAQKLSLRPTQVNQSWTQIYLAAQSLRNRDCKAEAPD